MAVQTKLEAFAVAGEETSNWSARGEEELCGWRRCVAVREVLPTLLFIGRGRGRGGVTLKKVPAGPRREIRDLGREKGR